MKPADVCIAVLVAVIPSLAVLPSPCCPGALRSQKNKFRQRSR